MLSQEGLDAHKIESQKYWPFDPVGYKYRLILKQNPRIFLGDKSIRDWEV